MDNKRFWKTIRPKFLNKCKTANKNIFVENNPFSWFKEKKYWTWEYSFKNCEKFQKHWEYKDFLKESQQAAENSSFSFKVIREEEVKNAIETYL